MSNGTSPSVFDDMTNKDLKEYCDAEEIFVASKNVSKPTKKEYLLAIQSFEKMQHENIQAYVEQAEPVLEEVEVESDNEPEEEDEFFKEIMAEKSKVASTPKKKGALTRAQKRKKQYDELMPLKRVLITSNATNQTKSNVEYVTWGNGLLGHKTDLVYMGKPWHVREGALRNMRNANVSISRQDGNNIVYETVPAYNIQVLDALSPEEIEKIAKRQTIRDASIESLI